MRACRLGFVVLGCATLAGLEIAAAAQALKEHKGLEITAKSVERSTRVSLQDCPPGDNIVRGVIRPVEDNEFATVRIDVKVLPSFEPVQLAKPVLYDKAGKAYKTAQSFGELEADASYSCNFSFRVPKGTQVTRFEIDKVSLDVSSLEE